MRFWVRLSHLGLGFWTREERRAAGGRREKKENESEKMKGNRVRTFYIRRWTRWVLTRSSAPRFKPLDLDPDGSGSIQHLWGVLEIRIHQPAWVWAGYPRFFWFSFQYSWFVAIFTPVLATWTTCAFKFSHKNSKKLLCVLDMFCDILHAQNW